jgi:hypothetical protein
MPWLSLRDERCAGARLVELEYDHADLLERDWPREGHLRLGKARVVSSERALA